MIFMKSHRSVIIGASGKRANHHALAYKYVKRASLVAVSARTAVPRDQLAAEYGISKCYNDYQEMLYKEKPDLVHIVTNPSFRLEILKAVDDAKIPAAIIEKPIAIDTDDCLELSMFAQNCKTKIVVNHQLHYHQPRMRLMELVTEGAIGKINLIDASCGMNAAFQGTHTIQGVLAFAGLSRTPSSLFAQATGTKGLFQDRKNHLAPDDLLIHMSFQDGLRATLTCGNGAPYLAAAPVESQSAPWAHKRISVFGDYGHIEWTMWSWKTLIKGVLEKGSHDYWVEDAPAEARLVDSIFDLLECNLSNHPLSLVNSIKEYLLLLTAYQSVIQQDRQNFPTSLQSNLIRSLRRHLDNSFTV